MHLLCPHCHNPIELADLAFQKEIVCPSCGSSFQLERGSTTTDWRPGRTSAGFSDSLGIQA